MTAFQLSCFISVESHLSFTKAAEDRHVAQATISRQINMLEEELGCKLFVRDSHGVKTTPAGDMLAHYAPVFLEYQRNISEQIRNASKSESTPLRIGVGPYEHVLMNGPLRELHEKDPGTAVNLNTYTYYVLLTRYRNKVLDMALCNDICASHMVDYKAHEICRCRWQVAAAANSPFWGLPREAQQKMKDQRLITLVNDQFDGVRSYCYDHFISPYMVETNFLTTLLEQVQAGLGIAILPPFVKKMLPPDVVMRDVLSAPHTQSFYAMVSPSFDPQLAELLVSLFRESAKNNLE